MPILHFFLIFVYGTFIDAVTLNAAILNAATLDAAVLNTATLNTFVTNTATEILARFLVYTAVFAIFGKFIKPASFNLFFNFFIFAVTGPQ